MSWPKLALSDVAEVRLGRQRAPKNHHGDEMRPYLRAANVTWDGLNLADIKTMNFTDQEMATYRLEPGDLLLSEASGSPGEVGKPALWSGEIADCAFQNTLIRVRPRRHEPKFLLHFLRWQALTGRFIEHSRGVGIHHLGRARLASWPTPVPPLEEQRRIVAIIEDHFSRLDAAVAGVAASQRRIEVLRQSVVDDAFRRMIDPDARQFHASLMRQRLQQSNKAKQPASADTETLSHGLPWPIASLEEVTDPDRRIRYGILKPASESGDVPYVEVRDLRVPLLDPAKLKRTSSALDHQFAGARLRGGDVVVAVGARSSAAQSSQPPCLVPTSVATSYVWHRLRA